MKTNNLTASDRSVLKNILDAMPEFIRVNPNLTLGHLVDAVCDYMPNDSECDAALDDIRSMRERGASLGDLVSDLL